MLRLLPERLYAGLFGPDAWLAQGAGAQAPSPIATQAAVSTPPEQLEAMLQAMPLRRPSGKLSVMLPSQFARCISLPWSAALRGDEERHAYALAHLEQAGLGTFDSHAVHAEFRHYGAQGFAYAVSQHLLDELHAVAARHKLELTTVLPIGGIAHLAARRARGAGLDLTLILEEASVGALAMDRKGLQRYDAEPAVGGRTAALRRLLTRMAADAPRFDRISLCAERDGEELAGSASPFAANGAVQRVKPSQWRKFL